MSWREGRPLRSERRTQEINAGAQRNGTDHGPGTIGSAEEPARRCGGEDHAGGDDDGDEAGDDERQSTEDGASRPGDPPRAVDRHLGRRWTWENCGRRHCVVELLFTQPGVRRHAQRLQECEMRWRPTESRATETPPRAHHRAQRNEASVGHAGPVWLALQARGSHGSSGCAVADGAENRLSVATPGTSGTVVAVTGCVVLDGWVEEVDGADVVVVVAAVGSDGATERSEPVWTVTVDPGARACGL